MVRFLNRLLLLAGLFHFGIAVADSVVVSTQYACDPKSQILYVGDYLGKPENLDQQSVENLSIKLDTKNDMALVLSPNLDYTVTSISRVCVLQSGRYDVTIGAGPVRYEGTRLTVQPLVSIKRGERVLKDGATVGDREYLEIPDEKGCSVGWAVSYTLHGKTGSLVCER